MALTQPPRCPKLNGSANLKRKMRSSAKSVTSCGKRPNIFPARDETLEALPVKRNRFVDLKAPNKQVNWSLVTKNKALAGLKGYETSRVDLPAEQLIHAYRQLLKIEKAFRMSKSDLKARPIYHHQRESIDAHLSVVMAAMAVGHLLEERSGLSLKRLVRTLKKYRTFEVQIAGQLIHAASPVPPEISELIERIHAG